MPGGDRTGPMGAGPMTGRALGYCTGHAVPGYMSPYPGRGWGRGGGFSWGRGWGRGWGRRWWGAAPYYPAGYAPAYPSPYGYPAAGKEQEVTILKEQARYFEEALDEIRRRLSELEGKD